MGRNALAQKQVSKFQSHITPTDNIRNPRFNPTPLVNLDAFVLCLYWTLPLDKKQDL